jgi:hypothetical protein
VSMPMLDPDRAEQLKNRVSATRVRTELVSAWSRTDKELPAVEVDVKWVRFSTLNHRTRAEQDKAKQQAGRDDLFSADPLGPEAQDAQFKILCHQEGFEDLKADMKERGQQHPAIITADGILINGNRRAAAMRSLYDEHHLKAQYIRCLVLPEDASVEEIVDLEAELQIAREFKQGYSWVNEALLIEELYDREGKSFDKVAKRMHRNVKDVKEMYEKIQQVHQLVAMSQGSRHLVDFKDRESVFDELAKHIKNRPPKEQTDVRTVYFLGALSGTEYRTLRHLRRPDAAELVLHEVESDPAMRPILEAANTGFDKDSGDELLDEVLGGNENQSPLEGLLSLLAAKKSEANIPLPDGQKILVEAVLGTVKTAVVNAAREAEESDKDQGALTAPGDRVEKAISELYRANDSLARARAVHGWDEAEFRDKVHRLEKAVAQLKASR